MRLMGAIVVIKFDHSFPDPVYKIVDAGEGGVSLTPFVLLNRFSEYSLRYVKTLYQIVTNAFAEVYKYSINLRCVTAAHVHVH
jgi:hypothetical protein